MIDHGFYERNGILDPEASKQKRLTDVLRRWHLKEIDSRSCREELDKVGLSQHEIASFMRMSWDDLGLGVEPVPASVALKAMNDSLRKERWGAVPAVLPFDADAPTSLNY